MHGCQARGTSSPNTGPINHQLQGREGHGEHCASLSLDSVSTHNYHYHYS